MSGTFARWSGEVSQRVKPFVRPNALISVCIDSAFVAAVWAALLVAENIAIGFLWPEQFSGAWEIALSRHVVVPMAAIGLAPASLFVAAGWALANDADRSRRLASRCVLATVGALAAAATALSVTEGRHFKQWGVRGPFVFALALAGWWFGARVVPWVAGLSRHRARLGAFGAAVALTGWFADEYALPRLYPGFHAALCVLTLLGAALIALAAASDLRARSPVFGALIATSVGVAFVDGAARIRTAGDALDRATNLRIVLVEHAPLLGRAVAVAVRIRSALAMPLPSSGSVSAAPEAPREVARALDWTGHDLVLLTVDALRADHVFAYGYSRPTTPNIDALAKEGALFEHAYCPTPHTSYSVTSMMTGKYLRPLLVLGLGQDSETWAQYVRQYGFRTAAFYPPAVFFIDEARFTDFEQSRLGFEYAKVEFADPKLREAQVRDYLETAAADRSLFLWVHFFEPHEPYVRHSGHEFAGGTPDDIDSYDSEVATADEGIGRIVHVVREHRPGAIFIVTADHGEEFGEHGGRYHGTTVYEEQARVPLVVAGPGVRGGTRVATVVQTVDLLPTVLSALGIPRPSRLRGRDLGPLLRGTADPSDPGFAFAETDDYALVAAGRFRLICQRQAAACALYDPAGDTLERHDIGPDDPKRLDELRDKLRATERDHGRYETIGTQGWPEALRRGLQGEADAAPDVASLLDDADLNIRRKASEVLFALRSPATVPALRRSFDRDEDVEVHRWTALALVRLGDPPSPVIESVLHDTQRDWRRRAAMVLAERGDARGCEELSAWWNDVAPMAGGKAPPSGGSAPEVEQVALDLARAQELLAASARARCRSAVPALVRALADVRARPYVADALGAIGDERARGPLLDLLADEPYVTSRPHEARALLALGVRDWSAPIPQSDVDALVSVGPEASRAVALVSDPKAAVDLFVDGAAGRPADADGPVRTFDLPSQRGRRVRLKVRASAGGVLAAWLLRRSPAAASLIDRP